MTHRERCTQMAYQRAAWAMECYATACDRPWSPCWTPAARDWWASAFFWLDFAGELDPQD